MKKNVSNRKNQSAECMKRELYRSLKRRDLLKESESQENTECYMQRHKRNLGASNFKHSNC